MRVSLALLLGCSLFAAGCSSTSPSASTLTGTWAGTLTDGLVDSSLTMTLNDSGSALTGTWTSGTIGGGNVTGTVSGATVTLTLTSSLSTSCSVAITATLNGTQMSGTDQSQVCAVGLNGNVTLTRQ